MEKKEVFRKKLQKSKVICRYIYTHDVTKIEIFFLILEKSHES